MIKEKAKSAREEKCKKIEKKENRYKATASNLFYRGYNHKFTSYSMLAT